MKFLQNFFKSISVIHAFVLVFGMWGVYAIAQATAHLEMPDFWVRRQVLWLMLGLFVSVVIATFSFEKIYQYSYYLYGVGVFLMLLLLFLGESINGMKGWFVLPWFSLQPSEFIKPFFCLALGRFYLDCKEEGYYGHRLYLYCFGFTLIPVFALLLQPDFGTALIFLMSFFCLYYLLEGEGKAILCTLAISLPIVIWTVWRKAYLWDRLKSFWSPNVYADGTAYHAVQLRRALANGGLTGKGVDQGVWSQAYVPLSHNDSIYSSFGELHGLIGTVSVLGVFLFVALWSLKIYKTRKKYSGVIFGILLLPIIQAFIHMSVNTLLFPVTGVNLPLFSYGGSSMMAMMIVLGFVLSYLKEEQKRAFEEETHSE